MSREGFDILQPRWLRGWEIGDLTQESPTLFPQNTRLPNFFLHNLNFHTQSFMLFYPHLVLCDSVHGKQVTWSLIVIDGLVYFSGAWRWMYWLQWSLRYFTLTKNKIFQKITTFMSWTLWKKCNYFIPRKYSSKSCTLLALLRGSVSFFCSFCKNPSSIFWDNYTISSHSLPSSKSSHALSPCSLSNSFFSSIVVAWTCVHTHVRVCLRVCFIAEYTVCLMLCVWMFPCWPCGTG